MRFLLLIREYIKLEDGGQVSLDWYSNQHDYRNKETDPIVVLVPGLTGNSQTEYLKSLVQDIQVCGYSCVAFNHRSRGGTTLLTPKLYCAANCDDLEQALIHTRSKRPKSLIVAIGVSLGGIQLTRYLVHKGSASVVDAAVIISVAFNLVKATESLEAFGMNYLFNRALTKGLLQEMVKEQKGMLGRAENIRYEDVLQSKTFRDFDSSFTSKMFGFPSVFDYYKEASNAGKLHHIKVPTICLSSADDVFSPENILPIQEISSNSNVAMILTRRGGHVGFMDGLIPRLPFFSERFIRQYLCALRKLTSVRQDLH